jgi:hypothetical protein
LTPDGWLLGVLLSPFFLFFSTDAFFYRHCENGVLAENAARAARYAIRLEFYAVFSLHLKMWTGKRDHGEIPYDKWNYRIIPAQSGASLI